MDTAKIESERQYYLAKLRCCLKVGTSLESIHTLLRTLRLLSEVPNA
jgi:hypothetical protein